MTTHERYKRMYEHRDADRVPVIENPWAATIERWRREGLPENVPFTEYFDLDPIDCIFIDNSPRYEWRLVEETDAYTIVTSNWGVTLRNWKHAASTPEYIDFKIKDRETWAEASARMEPSRDRINWEWLRKDYPEWRRRGHWVCAEIWFGFDTTHSRVLATDTTLVAFLEDPEWMRDVFARQLETSLAMLDMLWAEGYHFDELRWPDDMGYKGTQFFSLGVYRDLIKPFQKRAIEWAHARGVWTSLHSCGNINPFVPEFVEIGLDALNPLEVKAGMDPLRIRKNFPSLPLIGGMDVRVLSTNNRDIVRRELEAKIPILKHNGFVLHTDHSVPDTVDYDTYRFFVDEGLRLGAL
ncbi:MAG: hypothetical protein FWF96_00315 [Kiritimatiellaeota bacterium]|nr:hypothetical protein [Kiritimatiellota bacterium]